MLHQRYSPQEIARVLIPRAKWHPYPTAAERTVWETVPAPVRAAHVERGAKALSGDWPSLPATLCLDFARTGNRERFQKPHFARRGRLADLVLAECMEGRGRFLDEVLNGIWHTCEESYWGLPAHLGLQKAGPGLPDVCEPTVDLFVAETATLLAWTVYLLKPELDRISPLICARVAHEIRTRVLVPCMERDDFWWMGLRAQRSVNNWNPWINSNWLTCALLLEGDEGRRREAVLKIMRSLDAFIDDYPADGGCDEGPGYWGRAGASLFDCLELLHSATAGAVDVYAEPLVQDIGRFICRAHIHDRWFINFADAGALGSPPPSLVFRYGKRIGDETMQRFGAFLAEMQNARTAPVEGSIARSLPALFALDDLLAARPAEPLLRDVWLPTLQVMVARAKGGSADGLFLAAKGGHNAESHNHNDVGHFIVFADGRPVFIDVGVETYSRKTFSPERYTIWTMQSAYHNLPTVNGAMQRPGKEYAARDARYRADDEAAHFDLDIARAYPPAAGISSWRRRFTLNRADDLVVEDAWELDKEPRELVFTLMTPCAVDAGAGGSLALGERSLPGGRSTGRATVRFDPAYLSASVEEVRVEDSSLQNVWGELLYRVLLRVRSPARRGAVSLHIVSAQQNV
jgi:hypothetical protein